MPISFPSNPSLNQTFTTSDGNFFRYNGKGWIRTSPNFSAIASGSITGNLIALGTITGNLLANLSIESIDVANGAITTEKLNLANSYLQLPNGTLAQRPVSPANGMIRLNTSNNWLEYYNNGNWNILCGGTQYAVEYLSVAGGGGAGSDRGGGGGAGGFITGNICLIGGSSYAITIGAGGTGRTNDADTGSNSCVSTYVDSYGGGGGGGYPTGCGRPGGSGGGASTAATPTYLCKGSGTPGQGFPGGCVVGSGGGGGGGASAVGCNSSTGGGRGGNGCFYNEWANATVSGSGGWFAGGGGGGAVGVNPLGPGGSGGGGNGATGDNGTGGSPGTSNTGGGGGGGTGGPSNTGGNGGSGIVILRYLGSQRGSGGTAYSGNGFTYHKFTSSGTYIA